MSNRRDSTSSPHALWIGLSGLLLVLAAWGVWWLMQVRHPEVGSAESLTLLRALYTACSSQNVERLEKVEQEVNRARSAGNLTDEELESFQAIIAQAHEGGWDEAARESYRFAEAQVR